MNEIFISIIVPVYNVEKYIEECLNSIFRQTYKNYELIIIIDGSKDNSENIIKRIVKDRINVKVISRENKGLLFTRIEGVKKYAKGEYILFVDSDDWLEDNAVEILAKNAIENREIDIIKANCYKAISNKEKKKRSYIKNDEIIEKEEFIEKIDYKFVTAYELNNIFAELIKKDLYDNVNIDTTISLGEDLISNLYLFNKSNKIKVIRDYIYNYRYNPTSITNCTTRYKTEKNLEDAIKTYEYLKEYMIKNSSKNNVKLSYLKLLQEINHRLIRFLYVNNIKFIELKQIYDSSFNSIQLESIRKNLKFKDIISNKCRHKFFSILLYRNFINIYTIFAYSGFNIIKIIKKIKGDS